MSISPTLCEQLFCTKVFCPASLYLQYGFIIFWQKEFGAKAVPKMLVKLTTVWRWCNSFLENCFAMMVQVWKVIIMHFCCLLCFDVILIKWPHCFVFHCGIAFGFGPHFQTRRQYYKITLFWRKTKSILNYS